METRLWKLIQQWRDAQFFPVSQAQLADKLGVTRSAVSQWKLGQSRPTPANLRDLARLTRIPYEDLRIAVVEDLGYVQEEVGSDVRSAPIDVPIVREGRGERLAPPPAEAHSPGSSRGRGRPGRGG